jgi:ribosomal protein S18 acetylase RimI-like enzyme
MTLPEPVRRFCYAAWGLEPGARRMPWGVVTADPRYPLIHDANNALVLEPDPELTPESIREALHPLLHRAGVAFEHMEFWEASDRISALRELRLVGLAHDPDLVMVLDRAAPDPASNIDVREVREPDDPFWLWYRRSLREFGEDMSEEVLDQLTERARAVLHPAGLRWFVGFVDSRMAGYTSELSLDGVAYLDNVVTLPEFRRHGIASATVARAARTCLAEGSSSVFLLTDKRGQAQHLYRGLGFRARAEVETFHRPLPA